MIKKGKQNKKGRVERLMTTRKLRTKEERKKERKKERKTMNE